MSGSSASPAWRRRDDCRLCGGRDLKPAFSLAPTPPANAFVPESRVGRDQALYPLDLFLCGACGHLQLRDVVDPAALFEDYVYVSGTSPVFREHFRRCAEDLSARAALKPGDLVVDVGSNDGTLLRFFRDGGRRVLGVDPAKAIAAEATKSGVETWPEFFTVETAARIRSKRGPAALVTANNVFAHADDLRGMAAAVRGLLAPGGLFAFEVSYLADVHEKLLFDTIYHEHVAYHAVAPLRGFFDSLGLELIEALRVDSHGGSLRGVVQLKGGARPVGASVGERLREERALGLDCLDTWARYAARVDARRRELTEVLAGMRARGLRVAAFGAPAKATTLMHHFGIGRETVDFIVDDSPLKQGLFSPGLHIPVLPAAAIAERRPDVLLITAWNFAEPIMAKNKAFLDSGGRFVVPLPAVRVIG